MNRIARFFIVFCCTSPIAFAQAPDLPDQPTTRRATQEILQDRQRIGRALAELLTPATLFDPQARAAIAPQAAPLARKLIALDAELVDVEPQFRDRMRNSDIEFLQILALLGETDAIDLLKKRSQSDDESIALAARGATLFVAWAHAAKDVPAQSEVLDRLETLVNDHPRSDALANTARILADEGAADESLRDRAETIVLEKMKGPGAEAAGEYITAQRAMRAKLNQPVVLEGTLPDGVAFSTADWKGKVILVDFWATWCAPCIAEMPEVRNIRDQYHDQGLEVLGISSDLALAPLETFLRKNPQYDWPHLFTQTHSGLHPLAAEYGVTTLPAMFLIDKNGVLRSVKARASYKEMIPKLLAE